MFGTAIIKKQTLDRALVKAKRNPERFTGAFMPGEWVRIKGEVEPNVETFVDARVVSVTWLYGAGVAVYALAFPIAGHPTLMARTEARVHHDWLIHKDKASLKVVT